MRELSLTKRVDIFCTRFIRRVLFSAPSPLGAAHWFVCSYVIHSDNYFDLSYFVLYLNYATCLSCDNKTSDSNSLIMPLFFIFTKILCRCPFLCVLQASRLASLHLLVLYFLRQRYDAVFKLIPSCVSGADASEHEREVIPSHLRCEIHSFNVDKIHLLDY